MVVFLAFSEAANAQIWNSVSWADLGLILIFNIGLLSLVLGLSWFGGKIFKFDLADRITIMFCGSKKSLASGAPMANVIFSHSPMIGIGMVIVPIMLFHQIQLMACTLIAQYFNERSEES